ncbi:Detected protein of unknown function [Hibiscus syriacus]|uniref:Uncharacterized protein n=1 Tax=Hibiscus syriacus TaxID=106335 RepID=A0A6A3AKL9_HIBSY|nr:Detected protein of unknown function [Hibiscus syriacus]
MQSRKLFGAEMEAPVISPKENLVPSETLSIDKDGIMSINERLFALHLAKIDRILQSVPSPGAGH